MTSLLADAVADHVVHPVRIPAGRNPCLHGTLALPPHPSGLVLLANGSGSSRLSPTNRFVADRLFEANVGSLMFDPLTDAESASPTKAFDIGLLADRLRRATDWVSAYPATRDLPPGYFGAGPGGTAALVAAARDGRIRAVVSTGGRPDLAGELLRCVLTPTLLIVGGADPSVLQLTIQALQVLGGRKDMVVVPRATHPFEEPGALAAMTESAVQWFIRYLAGCAAPIARAAAGR